MCPVHGQELDSIILMAPLQLSIFYDYFASANQPRAHASSSHRVAAPATGKHGAIPSLPTLWAAPATGIYGAILSPPTLCLLEATRADSSSNAVSGNFHPHCHHLPSRHGAILDPSPSPSGRHVPLPHTAITSAIRTNLVSGLQDRIYFVCDKLLAANATSETLRGRQAAPSLPSACASLPPQPEALRPCWPQAVVVEHNKNHSFLAKISI